MKPIVITNINSFQISLIHATSLNDKSIIQNLARFYAYDLSRHCGRFEHQFDWSFPVSGLYEGADYSNYWQNKDHYPFIIYINDELAGFVLINKKCYFRENDWYLGEFYIIAKFQGLGLGSEIAKQVFNNFKGKWEVAQMLSNKPAISFWRKTIGDYTNSKFLEKKHIIREPEEHEINIMQFESK